MLLSSFEHRHSWHGLTTPFFSNFLFTNLFSIKFLYFFIISSLFPYFNLFVSIFIQSYVNIMCRPYIDTNNPQDMKLRRFKNRTPARFEYIYCKLGHISIPKRRIFSPLFLLLCIR